MPAAFQFRQQGEHGVPESPRRFVISCGVMAVAPAVEVCPGTYSEQVTIDKSLALSRAPVPASEGAAVIQLPSSVGSDQSKGLSTTACQANDAAKGVQAPQSVIEICGATTGVKVA